MKDNREAEIIELLTYRFASLTSFTFSN